MTGAEILARGDVRYFAKDILRATVDKDPIDCIEDLEMVLEILKDEIGIA